MGAPLRRLKSAARRAYLAMGFGVSCPVCGHRAVQFLSHGMNPTRPNRPNARCQQCGSLERHRLLWSIMDRQNLRVSGARLLHFAPEKCLRPRLAREAALYVSLDLGPKDVHVRGDITALPFPDDAFDVVLCSHVLEHVPDDATAMRELRRVISDSGWAVIDTPVLPGLEHTLEDPDADEDTRLRVYGQADHVRMYGADYVTRLGAAGFDVSSLTARDALGRRAAKRHAVPEASTLHLCRPRSAGTSA